jgi:hypothetical protein
MEFEKKEDVALDPNMDAAIREELEIKTKLRSLGSIIYI